MIQTIEAVIHPDGTVRLLEPVQLPASRRAFLMILQEPPGPGPADVNPEPALLSEAALATDWNRDEEEAAWAHLQPAKSS